MHPLKRLKRKKGYNRAHIDLNYKRDESRLNRIRKSLILGNTKDDQIIIDIEGAKASIILINSFLCQRVQSLATKKRIRREKVKHKK